MSDNIPFDIQTEIIKRVYDVKPLLRFRSVSKPWKSLIDGPEFIAGYDSRDYQPHRLLLRYKNKIKYISFVDEQEQDFSPNVPLLVKQLYKSTVIGSSCGLWCLHGYDTSKTELVVIWNPSIRKSVGIVVPSVLNNTTQKITHFGLGVCPSTYDPTIVGISWDFLEWEHKAVGVFFTLSSNTWKMIPSSNMPRESIRLRLATQVAIDRSSDCCIISKILDGESDGWADLELINDLIKFWNLEAYNYVINDLRNLDLRLNEILRKYPTINRRGDFPNEFVFRSGISAYQVEGAVLEDGRTLVFGTLLLIQGSGYYNGANGDVACDGYHKYKEDVQLMADTGLEAFRFSISWSRLIPDGRGSINVKGIQSKREFGDRVKHWTTFNEANVSTLGGYDMGFTPPGRSHNLLLAHASAVRLYWKKYKFPNRSGVDVDQPSCYEFPHLESLHLNDTRLGHEFDSVKCARVLRGD
ncbi:beta-glucosidase 11-like protein isoform X2 [Tanacetum coccineum]